jgi:hypothetical protein
MRYFGHNYFYGYDHYDVSTGYASGSYRAPIFYDNNDTGYYLDPNSTSDSALRIRGGTLHGPNPTWGAYLYVGSNGRPNSYASVVTTNGNLHLDCQNGYETYINHYSGNRTYLYEIRTNFIYDRDDTSYYLDPNGTSQLSRFAQRTHAAINRGYHWNTPRFDYTGDTNYWTGTFGWGTSAGNWDNAWKAGFSGWDIWGGGTGHPQGGGYIHAQGIVSGQHYATSDGGAAYGWMMVGAGDATANRYWARGKWGGGTSGWLEFVMSGSNPGYTLYAYIMYDANNTGYYSDPNGDSRLSAIYIDQGYNYGWWRNYGCTGLYNQSYGRGIWAAECGGNSYGNYTTYDGGRNGWQGWGIGSRHCLMSTGGDNIGIHDNSRSWLYYWGGDYHRFQYGYFQADGSIRSPLFYDNNNTGYYMDGDGSSRMFRINANQLYAYEWVFCQGNIIAYYSDERLKTKVGKIENPIEKISQLNGFYYVNNDLAKSVGYTDEKVQLGLSAQEVQRILPEIVTLAPFDTEFDSEGNVIGSKSGENYLTIDYDKLVPLLVEAIKEQQVIIDKQKNDISEIKEMLKILTNNR